MKVSCKRVHKQTRSRSCFCASEQLTEIEDRDSDLDEWYDNRCQKRVPPTEVNEEDFVIIQIRRGNIPGAGDRLVSILKKKVLELKSSTSVLVVGDGRSRQMK